MIYLLVIFFLICLWNVRFTKNDCLTKESTSIINGIFVGLVFFSHFSSYINYSNPLYNLFFKGLGQLMVAPFLFFSGYGIYESIKNKKDYLKNFPKKRFLKLFINFSLAIIFFLIYSFIIGKKYSLMTILLSFIGWTSIGNSNWYIFAMLCLYAFTYLSFKIFKNKKLALGILLTLSIIYMIIIHGVGKSSAWYNTILCYPFGMIFSEYKDIILKSDKHKIIALIILFLLFGISLLIRHNYFIYALRSCIFVIVMILVLQYIKIGNPILKFLGKYTFEIYILQRLAFMICQNFHLNNVLYFICSILVTSVICIIYKFLQNKINYIYK